MTSNERSGGGGVTLSVKLEELDALIQEVRAIRKENIEIFQALTQHHQAIFNLLAVVNNNVLANDILGCISRMVRLQSAEFMAKKLDATSRLIHDKTDHLRHALAQVDIAGLYLEFGVFSGDSINLIATEKPDKIIYGFDSFEGLPEDWSLAFPKGSFDVGGKLPPVKENVRLVKGWFDKTLPKFVAEHKETCAFVHIDCDLYSSAKIVFDALKDRIVSGTVIVFDEYMNYLGWERGEHKAFVDFLSENNLKCDYLSCSEMQVAVKIK